MDRKNNRIANRTRNSFGTYWWAANRGRPGSVQHQPASRYNTSRISSESSSCLLNERKLEELLAKSPEDIVLSFEDTRYRICDGINAASMSVDVVSKLTRVLGKAFGCNSIRNMVQSQIDKIAESTYFRTHLSEALSRASVIYNNELDLIADTIQLLCRMLFLHPTCRVQLGPIKDKIELLLLNSRLVSKLELNKLNSLFEILIREDQQAAAHSIPKRGGTFSNPTDHTGIEPPEDFTQLSVVPSFDDLLSNETSLYLRKNITNGAYSNVNHYLDVQFRLLREDFLQPLRVGVQKLREIIREARFEQRLQVTRKTGTRPSDRVLLPKEIKSSIAKIDSLSVYFDCSIVKYCACDVGMVFAVHLSVESINLSRLTMSKKLMFGSLVCMSNDLFESTCLVGCICERDTERLKRGIIMVKLALNVDQMRASFDNNNNGLLGAGFILLETSAFFESYKHVLNALVSFRRDGEECFPFCENLVYCQNSAMPIPKYLENMEIDFSVLLANKMSIKKTKCSVADLQTWPSAAEMGLDSSQYEAIKLALLNKLTLIQGPPGTGKTFIGVKLVQLLMANKELWLRRGGGRGERSRPILMVCYTNHALDQFLESCIEQCHLIDGVVRVGGQSRSLKLDRFKLFNLRQRNRFHFSYVRKNLNREFVFLNAKLTYITKTIKYLSRRDAFLRFESFERTLNKQFVDYFKRKSKSPTFSLLEWLGFFDDELFDLTRAPPTCDFASFESAASNIVNSLGSMNLTGESSSEALVDGQFKYDDLISPENSDDEPSSEDEEIILEEMEEEIDWRDEYENAFADLEDKENQERMLEDDIAYKHHSQKIKAELMKEACERLNEQKIRHKVIRFEQIQDMREQALAAVAATGENNFVRVRRKDAIGIETQIYYRSMLHKIASVDNDDSLGRRQAANIDEKNANLDQLSYSDRFVLYKSWLDKFTQTEREEFIKLSEEYNRQAETLQELRMQEDRSIMQNACIVAMTTTGSSRYHSVLKDVGPRIVIVEEAAEVFESHIVASLSKHCEHLILIGDHVQLRPNPAVYRLAKDFSFDVSLFERLINNDTKKVMLTCQHRMRPEISSLVQQFYDDPIKNHESVFGRNSVVGLKKNVFFINHSHPEDRPVGYGNTSKTNTFEARYVAKLAEYLVKQKQFQSEQITVLSMYLGQMGVIKKILVHLGLASVKCTTVDNYQGEENEVVLLSLVRSNKEGRVGFLDVQNRVCVALSRARHGFYVIGNIEFICKAEKNGEWTKIVEKLKQEDCYGNELALSCGWHAENDILVSEPDQFDLRPDGGCQLACEFRLPRCGHTCALKCHSFDALHTTYVCKKNCDKTIPRCGHVCKQQCQHGKECNECRVMMDKKVPGCGHDIEMRCDTEPKREDCKFRCEKILKCGHKCTRMCGELVCEPCETLLDVDLACVHGGQTRVKCSASFEERWRAKYACESKCDLELECGHMCPNKCSQCLGGYVHGKCTRVFDQVLFCGHSCQRKCSNESFDKCQEMCQNECVHSKCKKKCWDACEPCGAPCAYRCPHLKCSKLCSELCDRLPCNRPCPRRIAKCGHPCIGLCGEPCPKLCRVCHNKKVSHLLGFKQSRIDATTRFVLLPDCGHCVGVEFMEEFLETRFGGSANKTSENNLNMMSKIELPHCPVCKNPLRLSLRYSSYMKRQLELIQKIKQNMLGDVEENKLALGQINSQVNVELRKIRSVTKERLLIRPVLSAFDDATRYYANGKAYYKSLSKSWNIFKKYLELSDRIVNESRNIRNEPGGEKDHLELEMQKIQPKFVKLTPYGYDERKVVILYLSSQQLDEICDELDRIGAVLELFKIKNSVSQIETASPEQRVELGTLLSSIENDLILKVHKYKGTVRDRVREGFKLLANIIDDIKVVDEKKKKCLIN